MSNTVKQDIFTGANFCESFIFALEENFTRQKSMTYLPTYPFLLMCKKLWEHYTLHHMTLLFNRHGVTDHWLRDSWTSCAQTHLGSSMIDEILVCHCKRHNFHDPFAVAVYKRTTMFCDIHISAMCYTFLGKNKSMLYQLA